MWDAGNSGTITGWNTNAYNANLNSSILPLKIIGRTVADTVAIPKQDTIPTPQPKPVVVNLKIYPNPVYSQSIMVLAPTPNNQRIVIYDLNGQKLIDKSINSSTTQVDTSSLVMGIYIVKIMDNDKIIDIRKIIVGKK